MQIKHKTKSIFSCIRAFMHSPRSKGGFTLIELIIAMVIIAIISGTLWTNFLSAIAKGRDARRKQDLEGISKALELYYNDNHFYPTTLSFGAPFTGANSTVYMSVLPNDPSYPGMTYCYRIDVSGIGTYYQLYANLENTRDPQVFTTLVQCTNNYYYNYGISSPNVTP
jgi:prepilin-type N-terminal cleavage/methylation domain-containing protein